MSPVSSFAVVIPRSGCIYFHGFHHLQWDTCGTVWGFHSLAPLLFGGFLSQPQTAAMLNCCSLSRGGSFLISGPLLMRHLYSDDFPPTTSRPASAFTRSSLPLHLFCRLAWFQFLRVILWTLNFHPSRSSLALQ